MNYIYGMSAHDGRENEAIDRQQDIQQHIRFNCPPAQPHTTPTYHKYPSQAKRRRWWACLSRSNEPVRGGNKG